MVKGIKILFLSLVLISQNTFAQSIANIRKEKEKSEKEINYLNKLLGETASSKSVSVEKLNILQQKIVQSKRVLALLNSEVKYFQDRISQNESRIGELQAEKSSMLDLYAKLVYNTWKKRDKTNKLMFICSSSDFNQAYNRYKYFQQIQEYSKRQLKLIGQVNDSLDLKNEELKKLVAERNATLNEISQKNKDLELQQTRQNQYIGDLQKKEKELRKKLEAENRRQQKLAAELNKLITSQIKKSGGSSSVYKMTPEEKLVSDDFQKNRGRLPWPVAEGFISKRFGVSKDLIYKRVEMDNSGIGITTSKNSDVRAVFQGEVTEVWLPPGNYNYMVIIRHGNYLTMYLNLIDVKVKKGQKVKTKDVIGKVGFDSEKGSVLNFEVWKNMEKLNPELWLAK